MKKTYKIILLVLAALAVMLIAAAVVKNAGNDDNAETKTADTATEAVVGETEIEEAEEAEEQQVIDYDQMYSQYAPESIIAYIDEDAVTWDEYYSIFSSMVEQAESYFEEIEMYYGQKLTWTDAAYSDGTTYMDTLIEYTETYLKQNKALRIIAEENNITLDTIDNDSINGLFASLYGENGEKADKTEAVNWMLENGYVRVIHILWLTTDSTSGEALGEDELAKAKEEAESAIEKLRAESDKEKREKLFRELIAEYNQDPGMSYFEDGYTFTSGTMYEEFYQAALAIDDYEVTDIVETGSGYHVIMRLPIDPEMNPYEYYASGDTETNGIKIYAINMFNETVNKMTENYELKYENNFNTPEIKYKNEEN